MRLHGAMHRKMMMTTSTTSQWWNISRLCPRVYLVKTQNKLLLLKERCCWLAGWLKAWSEKQTKNCSKEPHYAARRQVAVHRSSPKKQIVRSKNKQIFWCIANNYGLMMGLMFADLCVDLCEPAAVRWNFCSTFWQQLDERLTNPAAALLLVL